MLFPACGLLCTKASKIGKVRAYALAVTRLRGLVIVRVGYARMLPAQPLLVGRESRICKLGAFYSLGTGKEL